MPPSEMHPEGVCWQMFDITPKTTILKLRKSAARALSTPVGRLLLQLNGRNLIDDEVAVADVDLYGLRDTLTVAAAEAWY